MQGNNIRFQKDKRFSWIKLIQIPRDWLQVTSPLTKTAAGSHRASVFLSPNTLGHGYPMGVWHFLDTSCHISPFHQIPEKTADTAAFYLELHAVLHSFYMHSHDKPMFPESPQRAGSWVLSRLSAHSRSSQYPLLRGSITAWGAIWEMSMLWVQAVDYVELNNSLRRAQVLNIFLSMFF